MWIQLKHLFWLEKETLNERKINLSNLKKILLKEQEVFKKIKIIITAELNETHMHIPASTEPTEHWKLLKKYWKIATKKKISDSHNIIKQYEVAYTQGNLFQEDYIKLNKLMNNFLAGNINENKAIYEFSNILYLLPEHKGVFQNFIRKETILSVINDIGNLFNKEKNLRTRMKSIVKHNLKHNINQIEIRIPPLINNQTGKEFLLFENIAREMEINYKNKIKIKYIIMLASKHSPHLINTLESYKKYKHVLKHFVGVDDIQHQLQRLKIQSPLPVITHAGEFFSTKDTKFFYNHKDKAYNINKALQQIQNCLNQKKILRIGHANILGVAIKKELKKYDEKQVQKLVNWQENLLNEIKRRGIIIETNPTSNLMIRGLRTYKEHPISEFSKRKIKFSISTDDRITFDTNLRKEFYRITRAMKWSEEELKHAIKMTQNAKIT